MKQFFLALTAAVALSGCAGGDADNSLISVPPTMDKYKVPGNNAFANTFGFNNKTSADWEAAYASCAKAAGVRGPVAIVLKDYGKATTVDLSDDVQISKVQQAKASACMHEFSEAN